MRTGLFGGSFDPIHNGHIAAAKAALSSLSLDRVIFIPGGVSPHKTLTASALARYEMVKLAVADLPRFLVSDYETKKRTKCYSVETVAGFQTIYPDDELFFIIGDDEYRSFDKWYMPDKLLAMCRFAVVTRRGDAVNPPFIAVSMPPVEVSSSTIRHKLFLNEPVTGLLPNTVYEYIKTNRLYKKEMTENEL